MLIEFLNLFAMGTHWSSYDKMCQLAFLGAQGLKLFNELNKSYNPCNGNKEQNK